MPSVVTVDGLVVEVLVSPAIVVDVDGSFGTVVVGAAVVDVVGASVVDVVGTTVVDVVGATVVDVVGATVVDVVGATVVDVGASVVVVVGASVVGEPIDKLPCFFGDVLEVLPQLLVAASSANKKFQAACDLAFRTILARKVIVEGKRNLELLQGLLGCLVLP